MTDQRRFILSQAELPDAWYNINPDMPVDPAPGWDRFWALTSPTMVNYYGYEITDSRGGKVRYGDDAGEYLTDVLTDINELGSRVQRAYLGAI